jgi:hypothetical protein
VEGKAEMETSEQVGTEWSIYSPHEMHMDDMLMQCHVQKKPENNSWE